MGGLSNHQRTQAKAVECGYLALYRYDPAIEKPLTIDSKEPQWDKFQEFLMNETRFNQLTKLKGDEAAQKMSDKTKEDAQKRYKALVERKQD